jgi:hypothetical protein
LFARRSSPRAFDLAERRFYFPHLQFGFDLLASALIDRAARDRGFCPSFHQINPASIERFK